MTVGPKGRYSAKRRTCKRHLSKMLKCWNNLHRRRPLADLRTPGVIVHLAPRTSRQTRGTRTLLARAQQRGKEKRKRERRKKRKGEPTVQVSVSMRHARTKAPARTRSSRTRNEPHNNYEHASHLHLNKPRLTKSGIHPHSLSPRQRNYTARRRQAHYDITATVSIQPQLSNFPTL